MAPRQAIGTTIRDAIRARGIRQGELARELGVSRSAVNAWINDRAYPQDYLIAGLEKALGVRLTSRSDPVPPVVAAHWDDPRVTRSGRTIGEYVRDIWSQEILPADTRRGYVVQLLDAAELQPGPEVTAAG